MMENRPTYLIHWLKKGEKAKYIHKEKLANGRYRYFYTQAELDAYKKNKLSTSAGEVASKFADRSKKASKYSDDYITKIAEKTLERAENNKVTRAFLGGGKKDARDRAQASSDQHIRDARINERNAQIARAQAASDRRKYKSATWSERKLPEYQALKKSYKESRAQARQYENKSRTALKKASRDQKDANRADRAYQKTALGDAEARVRRSRQAESMAEAKAKAQDRYDAAVAAARMKEASRKAAEEAALQYQQDYVNRRRR